MFWNPSHLVSTNLDRPYVYRQLVPFMVRSLSDAWGIQSTAVLYVLVILFGIGYVLGVLALNKHKPIQAVVLAALGFPLFLACMATYDWATACLWAWSLWAVLNSHKRLYFTLFVVTCFNRVDTVPFMILMGVIGFRDLKMAAIQGAVFAGVFGMLRYIFHNNPGVEAMVSPLHVIQTYLTMWVITLPFAVLLVVMLFGVFRGWNNKLPLLRIMFVVLFPIFFALHVVFGQPYEIRVFWEVYPIIVTLILH